MRSKVLVPPRSKEAWPRDSLCQATRETDRLFRRTEEDREGKHRGSRADPECRRRPFSFLGIETRGIGLGGYMRLNIDPAGMAVTVVDDEPLALDVLVRAARSWNFQCQSAPTAELGLEVYSRLPTPIVVTDLRMP